MSGTFQKIGNIFESLDFFPSPVLLRYRTEEKKRSKTGGCISLILIMLLLAIFFTSCREVLTKKQISYETKIIQQAQPSEMRYNRSDFLLALGFAGIDNLQKQGRYFDIEVTATKKINNVDKSLSREINMINCRKQFFSNFGQQYALYYERLSLNNFLCFPDDFEGTFGGKYGSQEFNYLRIRVKRCSTSDQTCRSDAQFKNYLESVGYLTVNYYFINKLINPTSLQPVSYYFQDRNFNIINDKNAVDNNFYVGQYQISTDQSLIPIPKTRISRGIIVDRTEKEQFIHPVKNGIYAQVYIRKSVQKTKIRRHFKRFDDLLSYIGGLFGTLATVFGIFMVRYNKCCFQLQMCQRVFKQDIQCQKQPKYIQFESVQNDSNIDKCDQIPSKSKKYDFQNFNLWVYVKYLLYCSISGLIPKFSNKWMSMQNLQQKLLETQNQMNVDNLLQKISYYQRAFQCLFSESQLTVMLLQQKISIKELKQQRNIMNVQQQQMENRKSQKNTNTKQNKNKLQRTSINLTNMGLFGISSLFVNNLNTNTKKNFNDLDKFSNEDETMKQVFESIEQVSSNSQKGDSVCRKLLWGIRQDVMQKYEKAKNKNKKVNFLDLFIPQKKKIKRFHTLNKPARYKKQLNHPNNSKVDKYCQQKQVQIQVYYGKQSQASLQTVKKQPMIM